MLVFGLLLGVAAAKCAHFWHRAGSDPERTWWMAAVIVLAACAAGCVAAAWRR